jgi:transmembrane sensor
MLEAPLHQSLRGSIDEQAIARIWRGISERRHQSGISWRTVAVPAAFGAALALALLAILQLVNPSRPPPAPISAVAELSLADGSRLRMADVGGDTAAMSWSLSDGSELRFEPGTRWEPLVVSPVQLVSSLRRGWMTFDVKPNGTRRWIIEAGPVTVEVIGTRFSIQRDVRKVRVHVERGAVLVRGELVPDKVQRLGAGQSLEVSLKADPEPKPSGSAEAPSRQAPEAPGWLAHAEQGKFKDAYVELGGAGLRQEAQRTDSLERLLMLADVARLSGHPAEAVAPLERIVQHHAGRPEAALAAVTLGRLLLDQLRNPGEAARVLERALALGVPLGLREDVYARLVEAHVRARHRAAGEAVLRRYEREFSNGRRRDEMSRWLEASQ